MIVLTQDLQPTAARTVVVRTGKGTDGTYTYVTLMDLRAIRQHAAEDRRELLAVPFVSSGVIAPAGVGTVQELNGIFGFLGDLFRPPPGESAVDAREHARTHGASVRLYSSAKDLRDTVDWTPYKLRGDFAKVMSDLTADPHDGLAYALVEFVPKRGDGDIGGVVGWAHRAAKASVVLGPGKSGTAWPALAWLVNDFAPMVSWAECGAFVAAHPRQRVYKNLNSAKLDGVRTMLEGLRVASKDGTQAQHVPVGPLRHVVAMVLEEPRPNHCPCYLVADSQDAPPPPAPDTPVVLPGLGSAEDALKEHQGNVKTEQNRRLNLAIALGVMAVILVVAGLAVWAMVRRAKEGRIVLPGFDRRSADGTRTRILGGRPIEIDLGLGST